MPGKVASATEQNTWMQLLEDASSDKRLPEKNLLVLGGSIDAQSQFIDSITPKPLPQNARRPYERQQRKKPKIANRFGLGYTYQDVLDIDQEDILARLSIHLLPDARPPFAPLLKPIFNLRSIPNTLAVLLLDWDEPWHWLQQVRERISILKFVLDSLDNDHKDMMDQLMRSWRERSTGPAIEGMTQTFISDRNHQTPAPPPPLGPGEWDDPLGIPICVVCINAEKTHILAREHVWTDTQFDFILQHLRTIVLKHGGSLIYTSSTEASKNSLTDLIRSSLGIHSLLKKTILKPEAIQRDSILIPPNWDTSGKIKTLDSSFEVSAIGRDWQAEVDAAVQQMSAHDPADPLLAPRETAVTELMQVYSHKIQNPHQRYTATSSVPTAADTPIKPRPNLQTFLATQLPILRRLEAEDAEAAESTTSQTRQQVPTSRDMQAIDNSQVPTRSAPGLDSASTDAREPITPMLMNVGGVNVDVEAAVRQLRERAALRDVNASSDAQDDTQNPSNDKGQVGDDIESEKKLEWLAGLATRRKTGGSTPVSPRP